jgi:hypothetical protein
LEQLYRRSEAGPIPAGYCRGQARYDPDHRLAGLRSRVTHLLGHGKLFQPCAGTLVNQWCGFRAIKAEVYSGPSWLDGRSAILMAYRATSRVWADVRDEIRAVAPGLYLGLRYRRKEPQPEFKLYFILEASSPTAAGAARCMPAGPE